MADRILEPEVLHGGVPSDVAPELELLARLMDNIFEIPGTRVRFGLDAIVGLVPGLGDLLTTLVSLYILGAARRYGVPRATMLRMAANVALDVAIGAVPLAGDVFDVFWKSNVKNVALLQRHVKATPAEKRRAAKGDWLVLAGLISLLVALLAAALAAAYGLIYLLGRALAQAAR